MRRVNLDYLAPRRSRHWPGALLLAASLGAAAWLGAGYYQLQAELDRIQTAAGMAAAPERRAPVKAVPPERLAEETKRAEAVVRELTVPWAPLMRSLEEAASRDVAILQLQPDAQLRVLKLTAEARNQDAMFQYLRRLAASRNLSETHLLSHQVQRDDPQRPIQFSVQATLR